MVVGFGHSLRLCTLASLICSPSGVMSNPKKGGGSSQEAALLQLAVKFVLMQACKHLL